MRRQKIFAGMGSWYALYTFTRHAGAKAMRGMAGGFARGAVSDIGAGSHLDLSHMYAQGKGLGSSANITKNEHLANVIIVLLCFLCFAQNGAQTLAPAGS